MTTEIKFIPAAGLPAPVATVSGTAGQRVKPPSNGTYVGIPARYITSTINTAPVALQSDQIVDSMMAVLHLNFRPGAWSNGANNGWRDLLTQTGLRYFRSMVGTQQGAADDFLYLYNNGGMKGDLRVVRDASSDGDPVRPVYDNAATEASVNFLTANGINAMNLIGIEGANEANIHTTFGWEQRTLAAQQYLFNKARATFGTAVPVVSASVWRREPSAYAALGDMSAIADTSNLHNYNGGRRPSIGSWGDPPTFGTLKDVMDQAKALAPGKPLWVTEYNHSATYAGDPLTPLSASVMAEAPAARYLLRGITMMIRLGAEKVCIYSFMDEAGDATPHGMTYEDGPGGPLVKRASYFAVQNFISVLADPGPAHTPASLDYTLTGDKANIETMLLQKRNGTWVLLVWQEVDLWNRSTKTTIIPPKRALTLTLPFSASVTSYEPSESATGTVLAAGATTVNLAVPGHIMALAITPAA